MAFPSRVKHSTTEPQFFHGRSIVDKIIQHDMGQHYSLWELSHCFILFQVTDVGLMRLASGQCGQSLTVGHLVFFLKAITCILHVNILIKSMMPYP